MNIFDQTVEVGEPKRSDPPTELVRSEPYAGLPLMLDMNAGLLKPDQPATYAPTVADHLALIDAFRNHTDYAGWKTPKTEVALYSLNHEGLVTENAPASYFDGIIWGILRR